MPTELIQRLENAGLDGLPALATVEEDGWLLRRSQGYSRRANCVMPLGPCAGDLKEKIDHAEAIFSADRLDCTFKVTPASQPAGLDEELELRGYERDAETSILACDMAQSPIMPDGVRLLDRPDDTWLETWRALSPRTEQSDILLQLLQAIEVPAIYAVIMPAGTDSAIGIGCARAVISANWVGLFDLAVHADHRDRGHGQALAHARLAWAYERGARSAYLQVMAGNQVARRLQMRLGFVEAYRYWYRIKRAS
ncbi:MAG: GNAT family N-acetyltransferase [Gemmatimonadetes bacterium]|jgi:GNAT superfamily N-acetyltransferase|nr:GNAT family N-acetyltransferase [Gemmatimonadota bacterium]MBT5588833.1 GNAT family N-acetyltransferase [Gemmatimonadota bacterium]